jgi:hypothetical protein
MPLFFFFAISTIELLTAERFGERVELIWRVEVLIAQDGRNLKNEEIELSRVPRHFQVNFENGILCHVSQAERDWEIPGDLRSLTCQISFKSEQKITVAIACDLDSKEGNAVYFKIEMDSGASITLGLICDKIKRNVFEPDAFHPFA